VSLASLASKIPLLSWDAVPSAPHSICTVWFAVGHMYCTVFLTEGLPEMQAKYLGVAWISCTSDLLRLCRVVVCSQHYTNGQILL
jgi:hypothetical protein